MNIQKIPAARLNPASYNPRLDLKPGDAEYEKLRRSIEEFGYVEPVIWNGRTGNIVGGHQRYKILAALGYTEIECVVLDIDEQREKALNVALNKISGEFDIPLLTDLLHDLSDDDFDVTLTGFDASELEDMFNIKLPGEVQEDNFDAEKAVAEIETPVSRCGDVWLLGRHRLMCGDSTTEDDALKLMDGAKARLVFTDPPWNIQFGTKRNPRFKPRNILNDDMSAEDFSAFLMSTFRVMKSASEPGCITYVVMSSQEWEIAMTAARMNGYHWSSTIIWVKDKFVISRKDYHSLYEPIWYGWLGEKRVHPLKSRAETDVWEIPRSKLSNDHPMRKPVELVARALFNSSDCGDIVLDLFGGSGTTLITAEQSDRTCYMMELDAKYCDVIVKRYIKFVCNSADVFLLRDGEKIAASETGVRYD